MLLTLVLHFFRLDQEGFANLYYAATVKSMLTSWHNFFYASFDPGGLVTVDKPPLGLWVQALSATIFGFNGFSLLLPQAVAGVLSVALIYHLVARVFGAGAGLVAALVLALTPISVAANRNNTMDSQLVFTSLLAAWAVSLAIERGKLGRLLLCAIWVGIGVNIKMLQAYMVLPAFWLAYLAAARTAWWKRMAHLALATITLVVVSFAWIAAFDLTPADSRPYAGSSQNNTMLELVVGHNGIARLGAIADWLGLRHALQPGLRVAQPSPNQPPRPQNPPPNPPNAPQNPSPPQPPAPPTSSETGSPGILRLFNQQLAGQISWLLPLALLGIIVIASGWHHTPHETHSTPGALVLWSVWLIPQIIFFSFAGLFHRYYLEMMAPAIAALVGAGVAAMWRAYNQYRWRGWMLPLAMLITALAQAAMLWHFPDQARWLVPLILGMTFVGIIGLILARRAPALRLAPFSLCLLALLLAPIAWSITPLLGADAGLPFAGPELLSRPQRGAQPPADDWLIEYLRVNRRGAKFLVATLNAQTAAPIILATGEPVMALGGFSGGDRIVTTDELAQFVADNTVRLFWLSPDNRQAEVTRWVRSHCAPVLSTAPRAPDPVPAQPHQLYDCAPN